MTDQRTAVIQQWMHARDMAKQWVEHERKLRDFIVLNAFNYSQAVGGIDGTFRSDLGNGYKLKLVAPLVYSLKDGEGTRAAIEYARNLAVPLPKPLVKWSPELSVSAYKAADDELRRLIAPDLTTKPGAPQLSVEEPK